MSSWSGSRPPVPWWDPEANVWDPNKPPNLNTELQRETLHYHRSSIPRSRGFGRAEVQVEYNAAAEVGARAGLGGGFCSHSEAGTRGLESSGADVHGRRTSVDAEYIAQASSFLDSVPQKELQHGTYQTPVPDIFAYQGALQQSNVAYNSTFSTDAGGLDVFVQPSRLPLAAQTDRVNANSSTFGPDPFQWQEQNAQFPQTYQVALWQSNLGHSAEVHDTGIDRIARDRTRASRLPVAVQSHNYQDDSNPPGVGPRGPNRRVSAYSRTAAIEGTANTDVCPINFERVPPQVGHELERDDNQLWETFKMRSKPNKFFCIGKVFSVLWTEPLGGTASGSGPDVIRGRFGQLVFSKVRWFVVVRTGHNFCVALAITTYGGQGSSKSNVKKWELGIIYSGKVVPSLSPHEVPERGEEGMQPLSIQVHPDELGDKLDPKSRIHYGRVYTIEHNLKVKNFGQVSRNSESNLLTQWKNVCERPVKGKVQAGQTGLHSRSPSSSASTDSRIPSAWGYSKHRRSYGSYSSQAGSSTLESVNEMPMEDDGRGE